MLCIYCRHTGTNREGTNRCHDFPSGHDFELPPLKISVDDREQLVKVFHCKHKPEDDDSFFDSEVSIICLFCVFFWDRVHKRKTWTWTLYDFSRQKKTETATTIRVAEHSNDGCLSLHNLTIVGFRTIASPKMDLLPWREPCEEPLVCVLMLYWLKVSNRLIGIEFSNT